MRRASCFVLSLLAVLHGTALGGPIEQRQATSTSTSSSPTAALIETTISGKVTTVSFALPTGTTTSPSSKVSTSTTGSPAGSSTDSNVSSTSTDGSAASSTSASPPASTVIPLCKDQDEAYGPFCQPKNETKVYVGDTWWVTWNPNFFPINSTVTIGLNYANNSKVAAWTSDGMPREKGFVTVTMQNDWLQGHKEMNLTLIAISYTPVSDHTASPYEGPIIMLQSPSLPPPTKTKAPDARSLLIGLPVALGGSALIIAGLFIINRSTRRIGLGNVMGRKRGYGVGKSRRQRLGLKKGAIRLQEREVIHDAPVYRDEPRQDNVMPAPTREDNWPMRGQTGAQKGHGREESLGSLVSEDEPNAFRREMKAQGRQR